MNRELALALRAASRASNAPGKAPSLTLVVGALATVVTERDQISADTPGISWTDPEGAFNTLLLVRDRLVHARVHENKAASTSYPGPVAAVEAAEIEEVPGLDFASWRVMTWHVTLADGAVISLRAGDNGHAQDVENFVRDHLLP